MQIDERATITITIVTRSDERATITIIIVFVAVMQVDVRQAAAEHIQDGVVVVLRHHVKTDERSN